MAKKEEHKVSVIIPSIVREGLYTVVDKLVEQKCKYPFEIVIIAQPEGKLDKSRLPEKGEFVIIETPKGQGMGVYRNMGIEASTGDLLTWIDDDELPMDENWIASLITPLVEDDESVTTAGVHIPLGQGYLNDCISWLGWPGGGYPGFEVMWDVDEEGYTDHLCSGNFGIKKDYIEELGSFSVKQKDSNEDAELSVRIKKANKKLKYVKAATVLHEARGGNLRDFAFWHISRGHGTSSFKKTGNSVFERAKKVLGNNIKILWMTLFTKYFPGVLFLLFVQYFFQLLGYLGLVDRPNKTQRYK